MKILASLAEGAVASGEELLARLGSVSVVNKSLRFKLVSSVSKAALVTKLALSSKFPVLAHLSLELLLVFFNELSSFLDSVELLLLGADINLKGGLVTIKLHIVDVIISIRVL